MGIITRMVRNGFDRVDLETMPFAELLQWKETLDKQLEDDAKAMKAARTNKK